MKNKSPNHGMVIATKDEYQGWLSGKLFYVINFSLLLEEDLPTSKFLTLEEINKLKDKELDDYNIYTYESWNTRFSEDVNYYKSKGGKNSLLDVIIWRKIMKAHGIPKNSLRK